VDTEFGKVGAKKVEEAAMIIVLSTNYILFSFLQISFTLQLQYLRTP